VLLQSSAIVRHCNDLVPGALEAPAFNVDVETGSLLPFRECGETSQPETGITLELNGNRFAAKVSKSTATTVPLTTCQQWPAEL